MINNINNTFITPRDVEDYASKYFFPKKDYVSYVKLVDDYNSIVYEEYSDKIIPYIITERIPGFIDLGRPGFNCRNLNDFLKLKGFDKRLRGGKIIYKINNKRHPSITGYLYLYWNNRRTLVGVVKGEFNIGRNVLIEKANFSLFKEIVKF
jgi:hypothetical protein